MVRSPQLSVMVTIFPLTFHINVMLKTIAGIPVKICGNYQFAILQKKVTEMFHTKSMKRRGFKLERDRMYSKFYWLNLYRQAYVDYRGKALADKATVKR